MPKMTVSFRTEKSDVQQLDELAQSMRCDRTQLLQEAIDNYLWLQAKHRRQIDDGLRAAETGDFGTEEEVEAAFALWREP